MDIKHLQALVGIADCGSFSAAADAIGTVQSNISAHVARLERELDAVLVDRSSGRLTEEGQLVVDRARRMMAELDAMVADVVALRTEVVGTVKAGMIGTTGRWLAPELFARLRAQHPHVHLHVADGTSTSLEPQLASGQLDLAVVTLPLPGTDLAATPLFEEDLMLVVAEDDPLAARGSTTGDGHAAALPLELLAELELLLPAPGTSMRDDIDGAFRTTGLSLRPAIEVDGVRMLASLAFVGYGPAILPATAVSTHLRDHFRLLPIEGFPRRRVGVALRTRGLPSAPTRVLMELLHAVVDDPSTRPDGVHPVPRPARRRSG